jgi:hypothetical protein
MCLNPPRALVNSGGTIFAIQSRFSEGGRPRAGESISNIFQNGSFLSSLADGLVVWERGD